MRLFKSNKSTASIDRSTGSRPGSPILPEPAYTQTQIQTEPQHQQQQHFQQQHQYTVHHQQQQHSRQNPPQSYPAPPPPLQVDRYRKQSGDDSYHRVPPIQTQAHPAHLNRSQSNRASFSAESYAVHPPAVTVLPQSSPSTPIAEAHGSLPYSTSRQVNTDKDHKRSKRSIFGLGSSKEKENSPVEKKGVLGRSGSVHLLRKHHTQAGQLPAESSPQSPQQLSPQYPNSNNRQSIYQGAQDSSNENIPQDPSYYDQHRTQHIIYEADQPHYPETGSNYVESNTHYSPQKEPSYQPYRQQEQDQQDSPEQYAPYQGHNRSTSALTAEQLQTLRPPSQASLGPPSPLVHAHQQDSRPSTAATNRYSTQSVTQPQPQAQNQIQGQSQLQQQITPLAQPQPQVAAQMARGDAPNGNLRQQMSQQRDLRGGGGGGGGGEDHNNQYSQQQEPRVRMGQQVTEQGRNTPPPRQKEDPSTLDYAQLLQRYEELQGKYSKVKRYYFEREAQVTHLQNTVANQRLSMSKTSLDDAQYSARFERLSGAINNLAFNIRKNWRGIPVWLRPVCNQDAPQVGTKEMTAVGRACITRWLFDTVFERIFHPGIDPILSGQLKNVERNLRRSGQTGLMLTDEQRDDIITKVTTWRLTTVEGLHDILNSRQSEVHTDNLTRLLTNNLTEALKANLHDPPPPGLIEGVATIVGQAVGICSNLPLESRDVCIEYYMPGTLVNETYMKVETGMTPLSNPPPPSDQQSSSSPDDQDLDSLDNEGDHQSQQRDVESDIREASVKASQGGPGGNQASSAGAGMTRAESALGNPSGRDQSSIKSGSDKHQQQREKKSSFLGGIVGKKTTPQTRTPASQGSQLSMQQQQQQQQSMAGSNNTEIEGREKDSMQGDSTQSNMSLLSGNNEGKIRFAVFLAVEVRGKTGSGQAGGGGKEGAGGPSGAGGPGTGVNVLCRAPVYEF